MKLGFEAGLRSRLLEYIRKSGVGCKGFRDNPERICEVKLEKGQGWPPER